MRPYALNYIIPFLEPIDIYEKILPLIELFDQSLSADIWVLWYTKLELDKADNTLRLVYPNVVIGESFPPIEKFHIYEIDSKLYHRLLHWCIVDNMNFPQWAYYYDYADGPSLLVKPKSFHYVQCCILPIPISLTGRWGIFLRASFEGEISIRTAVETQSFSSIAVDFSNQEFRKPPNTDSDLIWAVLSEMTYITEDDDSNWIELCCGVIDIQSDGSLYPGELLTTKHNGSVKFDQQISCKSIVTPYWVFQTPSPSFGIPLETTRRISIIISFSSYLWLDMAYIWPVYKKER